MANNLYFWWSVSGKTSVDYDYDTDSSQSGGSFDQLSPGMGRDTFVSDSVLFLEEEKHV